MDGYIIIELEKNQFSTTLESIEKVRQSAIKMGGLTEENITIVVREMNRQASSYSLQLTN